MVEELTTDLAPVNPPETPVTKCEIVKQEIAKYSGWDASIIFAIAQAENRSCDPEATGDTTLTYQNNGRTYGYSVSALQVRILEGREHCDTSDIEVNVKCAYEIWQNESYQAWSVFNSGKYKAFL